MWASLVAASSGRSFSGVGASSGFYLPKGKDSMSTEPNTVKTNRGLQECQDLFHVGTRTFMMTQSFRPLVSRRNKSTLPSLSLHYVASVQNRCKLELVNVKL